MTTFNALTRRPPTKVVYKGRRREEYAKAQSADTNWTQPRLPDVESIDGD